MRSKRWAAGVVALALVLTAQPAQAVSRSAAAALQGSGTISTNPFTGQQWITATGTAEGVFDDLPGTCTFTLHASLSGQVRYQGPGEFDCVGGLINIINVQCTVAVDLVGLVLTGAGSCAGTAPGPLALTMLIVPTSAVPTTSFITVGAFTVRISA